MLRRLGCKEPDMFKPLEKLLSVALLLFLVEFCFVTGQGETQSVPGLGRLPSRGWARTFWPASDDSVCLSCGLNPRLWSVSGHVISPLDVLQPPYGQAGARARAWLSHAAETQALVTASSRSGFPIRDLFPSPS